MKSRGVYIAGNWKMNHGPAEAERFLKCFQSYSLVPGLEACVIPPAVSISAAVTAAKSTPLTVAAQNAHWEKQGAFTGELSGPLLKEVGVETSLVGHSERRQYFGETDESARRRTESLLDQGFRVILCVGETRAERESGKTTEVLLRQLGAVFKAPGEGAATHLGAPTNPLIIAYEPVWAIGTGLTATPAQAEEAHQIIRKFLWERFGMEASGRTRVLYGGSVTPENIASLLACPNIDGALVGGASLKPESFQALLDAGKKALI